MITFESFIEDFTCATVKGPKNTLNIVCRVACLDCRQTSFAAGFFYCEAMLLQHVQSVFCIAQCY